MQMVEVASVRELIEHFGGPKATADLLKTTPQNVVNWRTFQKIPPRFYVQHRAILKRHGIAAPATMWGMAEERAA